MRLDVTRYECGILIDYLSGSPLKCDRKQAEELCNQLKARYNGEERPDPKRTFVPMGVIRSPHLDAHIRPAKKRNWSYRKPKVSTKKKQSKPDKPVLSAQQIVDSI